MPIFRFQKAPICGDSFHATRTFSVGTSDSVVWDDSTEVVGGEEVVGDGRGLLSTQSQRLAHLHWLQVVLHQCDDLLNKKPTKHQRYFPLKM